MTRDEDGRQPPDRGDGASTGTPRRRESTGATRTAERGRELAEQDLKATSESIKNDLVRLAELETEKQRLDASDPRVDAVSDAAVELADRIHRETRMERELSRELS